MGYIDYHHHINPKFYRNRLKKAGISRVHGLPVPAWSEKLDRLMVKKTGIRESYLSYSLPGVQVGSLVEARALARECNLYLEGLIGAHPDTTHGLGILPLPDISGALEELRWIRKRGVLSGIILFSNVEEVVPSELPVELFQILDEIGATVLLHPGDSPHSGMDGLIQVLYGWFLDTSRAAYQLEKSGIFSKFPRINWVLAHGGGVLPVLQKEIDLRKYNNIRLDSAKIAYERPLEILKRAVPADRIVFGSDFPWASLSKVRYWIKNLEKYKLFQPEESAPEMDREKIPGIDSNENHFHLGLDGIQSLAQDPERLEEGLGDQTDIVDGVFDATNRSSLLLPDPADFPWDDERELEEACSLYNSFATELKEHWPNQKWYGILPFYQPGAALQEIKSSPLDHFVIPARIGGQFLDNPESIRVWKALGQRRVTVAIHPILKSGSSLENPGNLDSVLAMARLLYYDRIGHLKDIRLELAHSEGVVTFLRENLGMLYYIQNDKKKILTFLFDFLVKRKLRGEEWIDQLELI